MRNVPAGDASPTQPRMREYTHHVVVEEVVPISTVQAARALFLQIVWTDGGGLGSSTIEDQGDPETHVGNRRRVAGGIREQILRTEPGMIEYSVVAGPFPVKTHLGRVLFEPSATGVRVVWECSFTPYYGFGWAVHRIVTFSFRKMLATLRRRAGDNSD